MRKTSCFSGLRSGLIAICLLYCIGYSVQAFALEEEDYAKYMAQCKDNFLGIQRKAKSGNANAQMVLSFCYSEGVGVKKDNRKFLEWLSSSASRGNADAQYVLCGFHFDGKMEGSDRKKAKAWCRKAAAQGQPQAKELLKEIEEIE